MLQDTIPGATLNGNGGHDDDDVKIIYIQIGYFSGGKLSEFTI